MLQIKYKNHGVSITDVWFATGSWKLETNTDIVRLHGCPEAGAYKKQSHLQYTLITDLNKSEDQLLNDIKSKNIKYEIRRSKSDGININYYTSEEILIHNGLLEAFRECYNRMFQFKNIEAHFNTNAMISYAKANALLMSVVYYEGDPIVFHSYVVKGANTRFFHSCSTFREEKMQAQLIGRANKRLHWEDWIYLKRQGIKSYDWGGIFSPESEDGIDKFKRAFGGEIRRYYGGEVPVSIIGKMALSLR